MTDMHKTWILRSGVFVFLFLWFGIILLGADAILREWTKAIGIEMEFAVERICFGGFIVSKLWDWVGRRVWIGTAGTVGKR